MATVGIIRRIGTLIFDAVIEETHDKAAELTQSPIENGSYIADHVIRRPDRITMNVVVSDVGGPPDDSAETDIYADGATRSNEAYNQLSDIMDARETVDVQTGLELYTSMVIIGLSVTQNADTAHIMDASVTMERATIVTTATVEYPPRAPGATTRQASGQRQRGTQQGREPDAPTKAKAQEKAKDVSILRQWGFGT